MPASLPPVRISIAPSGGDDTATIQTAIDAGTSVVQLKPGATYSVTGLTMQSGVVLDLGGGTIKLANGANADVIQGANFGTLTGGGTGGGITGFVIRNGTIDGNRVNQTGASFGIRLYGYTFSLDNLIIQNAYSDGLWTEWGALTAGTPTNGMEAHYSGIKIHNCGRWGWRNRGPHDSTASSIIIFNNNAAGGTAGGLWIEDDNATGKYLAGALQITDSHVWGGGANSHNWAIINDSSLFCSNCCVEGATYGQILNRGTLMFFGGKIFYLSTASYATGCGIQMGDDGTTLGAPSSFAWTAGYGVIHTSLQFFWGLSGASAPIRWVQANRCDVRAHANMSATTVAAGSNGQTITALTGNQLALTSTTAMPAAGAGFVQTSTGYAQIAWTGITGTTLTGVTVTSGTGTVSTGGGFAGEMFGFTTPDVNTSQIDTTATFLGGSAGMPGAASQHRLKGSLLVEAGLRNTAVTFTGNGTDYLNITTISKRVEFVNGVVLRGFSDAYSTKTFDLDASKAHFAFAGTSPTISVNAGAGTAPPTPTLESSSSDTCGQAQWGTGTSPTTGAQVFVTFGTAWGVGPNIVLTPANAATAACQPYITGRSTTGFNVAFAVAPTASQAAATYAVNWHAFGRGSA